MIVVAVVLLWASTIPATLFPFIYARRAPWEATRTGRHLMAPAVVLALIVDFTAIGTVWVYPANGFIAAVLFGALNVVLWQRLLLLIRPPSDP